MCYNMLVLEDRDMIIYMVLSFLYGVFFKYNQRKENFQMDYDRIILEMLDRIKALEDDVAELKGETQANKIESNLLKMPSKKYRNLSAMLVEAEGKPVSMTFSEIDYSDLHFLLLQENIEHFGQTQNLILLLVVG